MRGVMSRPTTRLPAAAASKAMSPVPQARSRTDAFAGEGIPETRRRFQRLSSPPERRTVIRS
jgi:hypothetical protein